MQVRDRGMMAGEGATDAPVVPGPNDSQTAPAGKREVDLYARTYATLLRSSGPVAVDALVAAHLNIQSSLHANAADPLPDMNAFMYSTLRLPPEIVRVNRILLGQSPAVFARHGYTDLASWELVSAPGRRRRWHYDGHDTLAVYVGSMSDLDDLIPTIVAWQIEWNKLHVRIRDDEDLKARIGVTNAPRTHVEPEELTAIGEALGIGPSDWARLQLAWGAEFWPNLRSIANGKRDVDLHMLGGTHLGFSRSARRWWGPVGSALAEHGLAERPVYFVSSNLHSIANILSGTARRRRDELIAFIEESQHPDLLPELRKLQSADTRSSWDNFLYFAARIYYAANGHDRPDRNREEEERGIITVEPDSALDVGIQIVELAKLNAADLDPRILKVCGGPPDTDAIIVNINYPLGLAAYHILSQVSAEVAQLRGVYVLGKAATLNARIGDVMISDVVYDEHSDNTYWFANSFSSADLAPFLVYGSTLDNQRAVTVKGTYLQNRGYLDFYYRENYTVVEMEAGPFLSALYEDAYLTRHPQGESVNLSPVPIDIGIIHYASDTPYSHAHTLGARGMSYRGMDSTYAATLAIVRRVFENCR
ncbi:MAG TPA: hypothetical protein VEX37_06465 [Thermomicrobiales bacterium]|nr:hypothetical protein [Thermomicrobiales bacterium]